MSASSKKKLRREQEVAKLTERQLTEQKEAKKLNLYTTLFVAVLAVLLVVALVVGTVSTISNSGIRERNTVALTVGDHELSNVELNYFYIDSVNNFLNTYGSYASLFGLDTTLPLDQQYIDQTSGKTWADDFLESATASARSVYALADAAAAAGYTLSQDTVEDIDYNIANLEAYAVLYGYTDSDAYLQAIYGKGATAETLKAYYELTALAEEYYAAYADGLTFDEEALRATEAENPAQYSSYTYNYYYLSADRFLEGGTTDEEGNVTYSEEEKAAAVAAAEDAAKQLTDEAVETLDMFNKTINLLSVNADSETEVSSTACNDYMYSSVLSSMTDWVTAEERVAGDKGIVASTSTSTDEEGNETVTTNGYYAIFFISSNDNSFPLINVRHTLVGFEGGVYDSTTGTTTYSDEEKAAAWAKAEAMLADWQAGEATEDSFAAMATEHSTDTGSSANGGLYTDVYPGQMVASFEDWCFDNRKVGDVGLVESTYGVHIMYFSGYSETTYRDYMINNELVTNATTDWYTALVDATTVTEGNTKYISKSLVLSNG